MKSAFARNDLRQAYLAARRHTREQYATTISPSAARIVSELFDLKKNYKHLDVPISVARQERESFEPAESEMHMDMTDARFGPAETEMYDGISSTEAYCQCSSHQNTAASTEGFCNCATSAAETEGFCMCSHTGAEEAFAAESTEAYCTCK